MAFLFGVMLVVYLICCVILVVIVLAQEGKGGGLSGLISGGSALGDTFGAQGGDKFFRTWTRNIAVLFILLSMGLTLVGQSVFRGGGKSVLADVPDVQKTAPIIDDLIKQAPLLEAPAGEGAGEAASQSPVDLLNLDSVPVQPADQPAAEHPAATQSPAEGQPAADQSAPPATPADAAAQPAEDSAAPAVPDESAPNAAE